MNRRGEPIDIVSAFQCYGESSRSASPRTQRLDIVRHACPGAGACGGMYTANTMASAIEALGMSLPYSASTPAAAPEKLSECRRAGAAIRKLLELDLKPRDIMTRAGVRERDGHRRSRSAARTNLVLHLIAMARSVGVSLTLDDFQRASDKTPLLADFKPSGQVRDGRPAQGGRHAGGDEAAARGRACSTASCMTVTGKTLAENLASCPASPPGQQIVHALTDPIKETGHIQILRGTLAPDGASRRSPARRACSSQGPAQVFD